MIEAIAICSLMSTFHSPPKQKHTTESYSLYMYWQNIQHLTVHMSHKSFNLALENLSLPCSLLDSHSYTTVHSYMGVMYIGGVQSKVGWWDWKWPKLGLFLQRSGCIYITQLTGSQCLMQCFSHIIGTYNQEHKLVGYSVGSEAQRLRMTVLSVDIPCP